MDLFKKQPGPAHDHTPAASELSTSQASFAESSRKLRPLSLCPWQKLKTTLFLSALARTYPSALDDLVDLGPLYAAFTDLRRRSATDGNERLRLGAIDCSTSNFCLSRTLARGGARAVHGLFAHPANFITVLDFHTHPQQNPPVDVKRLGIFSDQDIASFLSSGDRIIAAVISPDSILMTVKTAATPRSASVQTLRSEIEEIRKRSCLLPPPASGISFTKTACSRYALALYIDKGCPAGQLRRVRLA